MARARRSLGDMRALCMLFLVAVGCAAEDRVAPETTTVAHRIRPVLGLDPVIADLSLSAIVMWREATDGRFDPEVHLGCDGTETFCIRQEPGMLTECLGPDDPGVFNGCCDSAAHEIRISEGMPLSQMTSTIAHEIGHSLGLVHAETGLMNPARSGEEHYMYCIDAATLSAFRARYRTEALPVVCYGDDVRQEALSWYAELAR